MNNIKKLIYVSESLEDTARLGEALAKVAFPGEVVTLTGDLGAGKTALSQAFGKALGVKEDIISPTFNILKVYETGRLPFYHVDAYRLEGGNADIGLEEYFDGDGVSFVEWPGYISHLLPSNRLEISISSLGEEERAFTLEAKGKRYEALLTELEEHI